ncbi:right-handed parallel beta-helix repeat-containing protein [bacterium]|nr:right-handed parallel beta-helix repeat-containing protein [bacterium]
MKLHFSLLLFLLLAFLPIITFAQTEFEGEVSGEWTVDDSPYIQVGAASVPADETLEIRPGVTVVLHEEEAFFISGVIQAVGEEDNLITFTHPDDILGQGISIESENDETIHFEYCFFDSLDEAIEARRTKMFISHCHFYYCVDAVDCALEQAEVTNCYSESDQPQIGDFRFGLNGDPGGYYIITNNVFNFRPGSFDVLIIRADSAFFSENEAYRLNIYFSRNIEVTNNHLSTIETTNSSSLMIADNEITDRILLDDTEADVMNNSVNRITYLTSSGNVRNNQCRDINITSFSSADCFNNISQNISVSSSSSILNGNELQQLSVMENSEVTFYNNTLYSPDENDNPITIVESSLDFLNNIVCTDNEARFAFGTRDSELSGGYNCYFGFEDYYPDNEPLDGDFTVYPRFRRPTYGDLRLRADSPCIDAGDPDSDNDPDDTRADIGAYYFNSRAEPPCIISNNETSGTRSLPFSYTAVGIDEYEQLRFRFDDLPDWLEVMERDAVVDSATISGVVPDDQEDFSFIITAIDEDDMTDTLTVFVGIDSLRILSGYISGILRREDSPFLINDTAIVAADDSLIIEPGCRIIFQRQRNGELSRFLVLGNLFADGTEEDSIYILRLNNTVRDGGFRLEANEGTAAVFSYCRVEYGLGSFGKNITVSNSSFQHGTLGVNDEVDEVIIENSTFEDIFIDLSGSGLVSNNRLISSRVRTIGDRWEIYNNEISGMEGTGISVRNADFTSVYDNHIERCETGIYIGGMPSVDDYSLILRNNIILECNWGVSIGVDACYTIVNNLISDSQEKPFRISHSSSRIINNTVFNSPIGVYYATEYGTDYSLYAFNNIIIAVDTLISRSPDPLSADQYFAYNCFYNIDEFGYDFGYLGELDSVNANGDSTDSNFNLYLDPSVVNIDDLDFHLYQGSHLINAGHPDSIYFDIDSTVNDIGLYGGPYGEEYEYPQGVGDSDVPVPEGFTLDRPYPNPFNISTNFAFSLPAPGIVDINIYNTIGRLIFSERLEDLQAGSHKYTWQGIENKGRPLPTGIYYFELTYKGAKLVRRIVLLK